ncbi:DUF4190 domain-containing protein [Nocardia sp. BMG51109]|uniref:DUF4190 domain-containing protein n=1 Tax=Nocardia sp. BMG51109 TaxID=1056816 RepID=UPI000467815C|nr:DUF4190 domain-containing protein [Nocardia sp. BMG51109]
MLDFVYYPVSAVFLACHLVCAALVGRDNGFGWLLAMLVFVFVLRLCMYPLAAVLAGRLGRDETLGAATDSPRFPLGLYLARIVVHVVVFVGLVHVWNSFNRTGEGLGLSVYDNAHTANYLFGSDEVQAMLVARVFGAPPTAGITTSRAQLEAFVDYGGTPSTGVVTLVAVPMIVAIVVLTAVNGWSSPVGSFADRGVGPAPLLYAIGRWVLPVLAALIGIVMPIGMLVYLLGNGVCTLVEHRLLARRTVRSEPVRGGPPTIGLTTDGVPIYPVVGYTADGAPVTANRVAGAIVDPARTNSLAVTALVLGVVAGPLAIPFGHVARSQIRRTGEQGDGMALAGLILGYLSLVAVLAAVVASVVVLNGAR